MITPVAINVFDSIQKEFKMEKYTFKDNIASNLNYKDNNIKIIDKFLNKVSELPIKLHQIKDNFNLFENSVSFIQPKYINSIKREISHKYKSGLVEIYPKNVFDNTMAKFFVINESKNSLPKELKEKSTSKYKLKEVVIATIVSQFVSVSCVSPFD